MKFVLDTNTVSMAMAGEPSVTERMFSLARTDVLIPQPVIAEIEYGIARLPESERRQRLVERLQRFIENASDAPWTADVSRAFGTTKADLEARGQRIEDFDVAIAAHALALDAVLVTDNTAHLGRIRGLRTRELARIGQGPHDPRHVEARPTSGTRDPVSVVHLE